MLVVSNTTLTKGRLRLKAALKWLTFLLFVYLLVCSFFNSTKIVQHTVSYFIIGLPSNKTQ